MGQLVTTVAGGAIGFAIGGPMGAQVGMLLGGMVGSTLFGPTIKGPRLTDLKVTASTYGVAIPELYGTVRVGGNLIWTSGIKERKKTSRAGKGGPKTTTYSYSASFAMGLCKGTIDQITRIWADNKLIYDSTAGSTRAPSSTNDTIYGTITTVPSKKKKKKYNFRAYRGTEDQLPDSIIEADKGVGNVSAHRGLAYIVFEDMPLEDFGNRIPQLTFEITKSRKASYPSITAKLDGSTALPGADGYIWVPLWENDRMFAWRANTGTGQSYVFDINTMQVAYGLTGRNFFANHRVGFDTNRNLMALTAGTRNSAPLEVWNLTTLTQRSSFGVFSNSLSGYYFSEGPRQGELALGNLGVTGFVDQGDSYNIVTINWQRFCWILTEGGTPVSFYRPPFIPAQIIKRVDDGGCYGWRIISGTLQIADFAVYTNGIAQSGPDTFWTAPEYELRQWFVQPFSGETFVAQVVLWDPTDSHVFVVGTSNGVPTFAKYAPITGTYKFARKHPSAQMPQGSMEHSRLAGGTFGWARAGGVPNPRLFQIDLQNGDLITNDPFAPTGAWGASAFAGDHQHWDDSSSSLIMETRDNYRRVFFRESVGTISLPDIVRDIAMKSNVLLEDDIDVSELDDEQVMGFSIDRESSARDALKQLATAYLFDCYESEYKLKFRRRGNNAVVTIPESWVARDGDGVSLQETVTQELEMPLKITVNYYDITRDHQQGTQSQKRKAGPFPTMWTSKEDILELPITWNPTGAKQLADKMLKMAWANRTGYQFGLPWRYLKYDPTDVINVVMENGTTYNLRLTDFDIGADFSIEAKAVSEKATAYVSTAIGNPGEAPLQGISGDASAFPVIINTPLLRDLDYSASSQSVCYVSVGTNALNFSAAAVFMDDGIDYRSVAVIDSETVTGFAVTALPFTTAYESTDETSQLRVRLADPMMELESITQDEMLNSDANAALVGEEVIQFRDAVLQTNGEWLLTGLRRARRGTNYALRGHMAGERFLLLDTASISRFSRPPESYVTTRNFKAVPSGTAVEDATALAASLTPRDLMPYTPEDVQVSDDGTDVTVTMQRRSRLIAPLADFTDTIHYKEGEKLGAKITYQLWAGLTIANVDTPSTPTLSGDIPLFDASGNDIPTLFEFPLSALGSSTRFLVRLAEIGEVEGIPKWVQFDRFGTNVWDKTEFY